MTIEDFEHAASIVSGHLTAQGCEVVVDLSTVKSYILVDEWLSSGYPLDMRTFSDSLVLFLGCLESPA